MKTKALFLFIALSALTTPAWAQDSHTIRLIDIRRECPKELDDYNATEKSRRKGVQDATLEEEVLGYFELFDKTIHTDRDLSDMKAAMAADKDTPQAVKAFFSCLGDFVLLGDAPPKTPIRRGPPPKVTVKLLRQLGDGCVSVNFVRTDPYDPKKEDSWISTFQILNGCPSGQLHLVEVLDDDMMGDARQASTFNRKIWLRKNHPPELIESYPTDRKRAIPPTKDELGYVAVGIDASPEMGNFTVPGQGIMERQVIHDSKHTVLQVATASCRTWRLPIEPMASYRDYMLEHWQCRPLFLPPGESPTPVKTSTLAPPANDCNGPMSPDTFRNLLANVKEEKFRELVQKCGLAFRIDQTMSKQLERLGLAPGTFTALNNAKMPPVGAPPAAPPPGPPAPVISPIPSLISSELAPPPLVPSLIRPQTAAADSGLAEITFWNSIKDDKAPEGFALYLKNYPQGQFADLATLRVQQFTKPATPPPAPVAPTPVAPPAPSPAPYLIRIDEQLRLNDVNAAETILAELVNAIPGADVRDARSKIEALRRRIDEGRTRTAATVSTHPLDQLPYVWIPAGTFQMGCSTADRECSAPENPPHLVRLTSGYWLGQTEVTTEAYAKFAKTRAQGKAPMDNVTWPEAQEYCKWVGGSLPTEAEWEYAARAGSPTSRYGELRDIAWFKDNSGTRVHDAGQKKSNAWGAQDMLGNLWEWVGDWYAADAYRPATVSDPAGPAAGTQRVVRGGSWDNAAGLLRVSLRLGNDPGARSPNNGFRCALKAMP